MNMEFSEAKTDVRSTSLTTRLRGAALPVLAGAVLIALCCSADTTKPEVRYVYPLTGDTLRADTITLKAVATDNKGVYYVEFMDNMTDIALSSYSRADTFQVDWIPESTGMHYLKAIVADKAGNEGFAPWVQVLVQH